MYPILAALIGTIVVRGYAAQSLCPSPEQLAPCTCYKDAATERVKALCENFTKSSDLSDIFSKNQNWILQEVHIDKSAMSFIPASMLEKASIRNMVVSDCVLNTLFDVAPKKTQELHLHLYNVKLLRGFEWNLLLNSKLKTFEAHNMPFSSLGSSFRDNMYHFVERIWFDGSNTREITLQAFQNLKNIQVLAVRKSMLKTISRNMFPKPLNDITFLDFSYNKIMSLPEDIFTDMPRLEIIRFERNLLTTMSEKTFSKPAKYYFKDNPLNCNCDMKWTVTAAYRYDLNGECVEPNNVKGKLIYHLQARDFSYCQ